MTAGDSHRLADHLVAFLKDRISDFADIFGGDARQLLAAERKGDGKFPVGAFLGAHAEVDQVFPVERRQQERRWYTKLGEDGVGLTLTVEMRDFVLPHQS